MPTHLMIPFALSLVAYRLGRYALDQQVKTAGAFCALGIQQQRRLFGLGAFPVPAQDRPRHAAPASVSGAEAAPVLARLHVSPGGPGARIASPGAAATVVPLRPPAGHGASRPASERSPR